jgi:hypothetical protein
MGKPIFIKRSYLPLFWLSICLLNSCQSQSKPQNATPDVLSDIPPDISTTEEGLTELFEMSQDGADGTPQEDTFIPLDAVIALDQTSENASEDLHEADLPPEDHEYQFLSASFIDYLRVDRVGISGLTNLLITNTTLYNQAGPEDDLAGLFQDEIISAIEEIYAQLGETLIANDFEACAQPSESGAWDITACIPLILSFLSPDTLLIDTHAQPGFPNGRKLTDLTTDILYSILLLDLLTPGTCQGVPCTVTSLVGLTCPATNDIITSTQFPFLSPAQYNFSQEEFTAYEQVDRVGIPLVAPMLITSLDAYNLSSPFSDMQGVFLDEITSNLSYLSFQLQEDLIYLNLSPCGIISGTSGSAEVTSCLINLLPLISPDSLSLYTSVPPGFPNGRRPEDPAHDIVLGFAFLDLLTPGTCSGSPCTESSMIGSNPTENDVTFPDLFPYLSIPHE